MALTLDEIKGLQKFLNRASLAGAEFDQFGACRRALEREAIAAAAALRAPADQVAKADVPTLAPAGAPPEAAAPRAKEQDPAQR